MPQICGQGCRSVNQIIQQLEQGKVIAQHLSALQRGRLRKNIMAVYAETGSCELTD